MAQESLAPPPSGRTHTGWAGTLNAIEEGVSGTVEQVTAAVDEVTASLRQKGTDAGEAVHDALESVRDAFNLTELVQGHPWAVLGGSVLAGFVLGSLLWRPRGR